MNFSIKWRFWISLIKYKYYQKELLDLLNNKIFFEKIKTNFL